MWSGVDAGNPPLAAIFSVGSDILSAYEKDLFQSANPLGFILFARNCYEPAQLKKLTEELKETVGRECPILIDQEGGKVQRLKPPHWGQHLPAFQFGECYSCDEKTALEMMEQSIKVLSEELVQVGVNVNCAPVLDVLSPRTHDVIGNRAFSGDPDVVAALGLAACEDYLREGITPVIKHIPGHGRAEVDSHNELPRVRDKRSELVSDFIPFKNIASSDIGKKVWGMSAHIIYDKLDPELPATISSVVIGEIIREYIGFEGFLITDDLAMKALNSFGDLAKRSVMALGAGCDAVLHCNGDFTEMEKLAEILPVLRADSVGRFNISAPCVSV